MKLAKVIDDDRISGDNRFLAELVALWLDCQIPKKGGQPRTQEEIEKSEEAAEFFKNIVTARFINKNGAIVKNIDKTDGKPAQIEKEATTIERAAIDAALGRG